MATCSSNALINASACFSCLSEKQMQMVIAKLLCDILASRNAMATCDPVELAADAKCFACLSEKQMQMVQAQLLCEILHSGGTGETCITCVETGEPDSPAPCDCSLAYNLDGQFWFWNSLTNAWVPLIL